MITLSTISIFAVVVTLMVISPGPNGLLIIKNVPLYGRTSGFFNVTGIVTAFFIHGTLTIFGLSILILQSPALFFWLKVAGGCYLIYLGIKSIYKIFQQKPQLSTLATASDENSSIHPANATGFSAAKAILWYLEGLMTNILNPKVSLFYVAAFPQFITLNHHILSAYLLITIHALIAAIWFSTLTLTISKAFSRFNQNPGFLKIINALSGSLLTGLGVKVVLTR